MLSLRRGTRRCGWGEISSERLSGIGGEAQMDRERINHSCLQIVMQYFQMEIKRNVVFKSLIIIIVYVFTC